MQEEFYQLVAGILPPKKGELTRSTLLRADLKADSFTFLELVLALEAKYNCYIEDEALAFVVTLGDLEDLVRRSIGKIEEAHDS